MPISGIQTTEFNNSVMDQFMKITNTAHVTLDFCEYFDEAPSFHKLPKFDCSMIGFLKMICRELNIDNPFDKLSFSVKDPSHIKHLWGFFFS